MKQYNKGAFKHTTPQNNRSGGFFKEEFERVPLFQAARRFSCVFLSASPKDAARLNHHLSAAGIRVYHAANTDEVEMLLAITSAKILLIDIDRLLEPWPEILQGLDESHPNYPQIVLTAHDENVWSPIFSHFALDVVPKPAHLGDLLGALEYAHLVEGEINDPERARERQMRVTEAIRAASQPQTSKHLQPNIGRGRRSVRYSIQVRMSVMMDTVNHVWWKFGHYRTRKRHSDV
jgi:DNA-binding NarL/FixJ family response regulator